ncbi:ABC transporter substrate-binding protein [Ruminococcaceae bacterium OttesenSCG-928-A11]|nr:ABC transporter substrate-binding protein [Ruminococcaceae bacterium OttesenSCG-928-A11]
MKKRLLSLCICLIMALGLLAACGNDGGGAASTAGGNDGGSAGTADQDVLYQAYYSEPYITLDPRVEHSNGIIVLQNAYETLTRYNYKTTELDPLLAESWEVDGTGMVWTFKLREDVVFHDGTKMDAASVVGSIEKVIELNQGAAYIWAPLEKVEATGDYEVTFTTTYPAPIDLIASASYAAYIVAPASIDETTEYFNGGVSAGTGPYKIKKVTPGEEVVFEAHADYWGGWRDDQYKTVLIKKVTESSARRQLMETGEAHIATTFSSTDLVALRGNDNVNIFEGSTYINTFYYLNTQKAPMNNKDFRQAMAWAFPYEETVNEVLEGNGVQCHGMIPDKMWGHSEELFQYSTDLDKAAELIEASGIDTNGLTITLTYISGRSEWRSFAQLFQANLKKLGIELELREMNWDAMWELAKSTNPDDRQDILCMVWYPDFVDPNSWFSSLVKSEPDPFFNLSYTNNPEYDAMIAEAELLTATDRAAAEQIYIDLQAKLIENCEMLYLYDEKAVYVTSPAIANFDQNPAYPTSIRCYDITKAG